jgi:hypothetical protein
MTSTGIFERESTLTMVNETRLSRARFGRFLALWAAQEIDRQAIVHVSDSRCLRPAVRPIRREGHKLMLIQKLKDLGFQSVVNKRSHIAEAETQLVPWSVSSADRLLHARTCGDREICP